MAQAYVNNSKSWSTVHSCDNDLINNKRKVSLNIDGNHYVSAFKNEEGQVVVNIRKGTRSVTVLKEVMLQICDLKETLFQCCNFVDA